MRSRALGFVTLTIAIGLGSGACSGSSVPRTPTLADVSRSDAGLRDTVAYLRTQRSSIDVTSLLIFDYMSRRWGVRGLADYRRLARSLPGATSPSNAFVRLFGASRHASAAALAAVRDTDTLTAAALDCERSPLDERFARRLRAGVRAGGYQATHVLLALRWTRDLGCHVKGEAEIRDDAARRVASELRVASSVNDLSLEQAAFLAEAGAIGQIRSDWQRRVRDAQRADGGWAEDPAGTPLGDLDPTRSNFHSTGLALWYLLAAASPGVADTPMVLR